MIKNGLRPIHPVNFFAKSRKNIVFASPILTGYRRSANAHLQYSQRHAASYGGIGFALRAGFRSVAAVLAQSSSGLYFEAGRACDRRPTDGSA
jgi:hypothetical protein